MFKKLIVITITAFFVSTSFTPFIVDDVYAKGFSSGRSFSSSSFSRSSFRSSGSSSKKLFSSWKSSKSTNKTDKKASGFKSSKQASTNKFTGNKAKSGFKTITAGKQTRQAKIALKQSRQKFKKKPNISTKPSEVKKKYSTRSVYKRASSYNRSTYFTRRNQYYGDYNPPVYVYNASPSYGLWDTIFLYSLLSSMNNNSNAAQFAYNHQNDPDYIAWRKDAEKLALENAELKAQLAKLDEQTRKMSGTPDPNFIPSGIDADIAMSQEVLNTLKPTMRVCVASINGTYFRVLAGVIIPGTNTVNIIPVTTTGSGEILSNIEKGKCDAGFVQGDSYWNYVEEHNTVNLPFERVSSLYKEATHLICHENGPESIGELTSHNTIWFPSMSGAAETWKNFIAENSKYNSVKVNYTSSYEEAALKVSQDSNSCMLYVGAPKASKFIKNIDAGAKRMNLVLVDVDDSTLDNTTDPSGKDVYTFGSLGGYKNLNRNGGCWGYCSGDVDTLYLDADFIVANKWKNKHKSAYSSFAVDLMGLAKDINIATH